MTENVVAPSPSLQPAVAEPQGVQRGLGLDAPEVQQFLADHRLRQKKRLASPVRFHLSQRLWALSGLLARMAVAVQK